MADIDITELVGDKSVLKDYRPPQKNNTVYKPAYRSNAPADITDLLGDPEYDKPKDSVGSTASIFARGVNRGIVSGMADKIRLGQKFIGMDTSGMDAVLQGVESENEEEMSKVGSAGQIAGAVGMGIGNFATDMPLMNAAGGVTKAAMGLEKLYFSTKTAQAAKLTGRVIDKLPWLPGWAIGMGEMNATKSFLNNDQDNLALRTAKAAGSGVRGIAEGVAFHRIGQIGKSLSPVTQQAFQTLAIQPAASMGITTAESLVVDHRLPDAKALATAAGQGIVLSSMGLIGARQRYAAAKHIVNKERESLDRGYVEVGQDAEGNFVPAGTKDVKAVTRIPYTIENVAETIGKVDDPYIANQLRGLSKEYEQTRPPLQRLTPEALTGIKKNIIEGNADPESFMDTLIESYNANKVHPEDIHKALSMVQDALNIKHSRDTLALPEGTRDFVLKGDSYYNMPGVPVGEPYGPDTLLRPVKPERSVPEEAIDAEFNDRRALPAPDQPVAAIEAPKRGEDFSFTEPPPKMMLRKGEPPYTIGAIPENLDVEYLPRVSTSGEPYRSEGFAERAGLKKYGPKEFEVVPVEGGFAYKKVGTAKEKGEANSTVAGQEPEGNLTKHSGDGGIGQNKETLIPEDIVRPNTDREDALENFRKSSRSISERRHKTGSPARDAWDGLTKEEKWQLVSKDSNTGLFNKLIFEMLPRKKYQVSIDGDSLKAVNDTYGHETGDLLLQTWGKALKSSEIEDIYHLHGDELWMEGDDKNALELGMKKAYDYLENNPVKVRDTNTGKAYLITGGMSYGIGTDTKSADAALYVNKQQRLEAGERAARGDLPPRIREIDAAVRRSGDQRENLQEAQEVTPEVKSETTSTQAEENKVVSGVKLTSGLDITDTLNVLSGLRNNIAEAIPHLESIAQKVYSSGKEKFSDFSAAMQSTLGELWSSFKSVAGQLWESAKRFASSERGAVETPAWFSKFAASPDNPPEKVSQNLSEATKSDKASFPDGKDHSDSVPPVSDPFKADSWVKREAGYVAAEIKSRMPEELGLFERTFASPEWYQHKKFQPIADQFINVRPELSNRIFLGNDMIDKSKPYGPDNSVTHAAENLRTKGISKADSFMGKSSREYKELEWVLTYGDSKYARDKSLSNEEQLAAFERDAAVKLTQRGMSPDQTNEIMSVWKMFRQSYDSYLDLMMKPMLDLRNQLTMKLSAIEEKAKAEGKYGQTPDEMTAQFRKLESNITYMVAQMNKWRGFYAPRERENLKYALHAEKGEDRIREHHSSKYATDKRQDELAAQGYKVWSEEINRIPDALLGDIKKIHMASLLKKSIATLDINDPAQAELAAKLQEGVLEQAVMMIQSRGYLKSRMARLDDVHVTGYITDPIQRYTMYARNTSNGLAKAEVAKKSYQLLGDIDPGTEGKAYDVAAKYIDENLRNNDRMDRAIGIAKSIATAKYLGLSARTMLVNMTAVGTSVPSVIHQYVLDGKVNMAKVLAATGVAGKDFGKYMFDRAMGKELPPTAQMSEEARFLNDYVYENYSIPQLARDIGSISGNMGQTMWGKTMKAMMLPFGVSEKWNRGTTALAAFRLARESGKSYEESVQLAKTAVSKAHADYGKSTLPEIAMGTNAVARAAQMMYSYSKFGHNYVQMLTDVGFRKHNVTAFVYGLLAPVVFAGAAAIPFSENLLDMANGMLKAVGIKTPADKFVWDQVRANMGNTAERVGRYGVLGGAGVDISSSVSIGAEMPSSALALLGPFGGVMQDLVLAGKFAAVGATDKAVEKLLPNAVANIPKAYRESTKGVTTNEDRMIFTDEGKPYKLSGSEAAARSMGFTPSELAMTKEKVAESKEEIKNYKDKHDKLLEKYRVFLMDPDRTPEQLDQILAEIREYNVALRDKGLVKIAPAITKQSLQTVSQGMVRPNKRGMRMLYRQSHVGPALGQSLSQ